MAQPHRRAASRLNLRFLIYIVLTLNKNQMLHVGDNAADGYSIKMKNCNCREQVSYLSIKLCTHIAFRFQDIHTKRSSAVLL